ncbi:ribosome small subunit-dependent GTPase A [Ramlibacter sp. WS9]|uniref:ribosome small subunit-dependent GTPase A n=1 Tax=Ramlibacter sp. WS9 TaxID=1882741 RepID=UPI001E5D1780|nr:ribosome small subunit-dependent GTPase A [Ramlibacter sp. WS9]
MEINFEQLRPIGLTQSIANQLYTLKDPLPDGARLMRITEVQRDWFGLGDGPLEHRARALHKLLHDLQEYGDTLTVGDWVLVEGNAGGELWITARLPPVTQIARRANDGRRQPLASNVDTALLVMGLDDDFNPRRMERYIAMVRASGVVPVVVLTKRDIGRDVQQRVEQLRHRLPPDIAIVAVNGLSDDAAEQLRPWLSQGQTLVLLGSSGAGKSTLTNTLLQEDVQSTGGVRKGDGRGRHTTTARSLHQSPAGACIVDTPGLRTWRADADAEALAATFDDIETFASRCQFRDCRHESEPGCAVRAQVSEDRLLNYHKLLRDAQRGQQTPMERMAQRRKWKALGKAGSARARDKRG